MSRVFNQIVMLCLGAVCLAVCACAPQHEPRPNVWPVNANVHWLDPGMQSAVDVLSVKVYENASGIETLSIQGKSLQSQTLYLAYRVDWFSANGRKIQGGTSDLWKHKEVLGNDMLYIRDVAPNENAGTAQIVIREMDRQSPSPQQQTKER